jgi:hypothetical protein
MNRVPAALCLLLFAAATGCSALLDSGPKPRDGDAAVDPDAPDGEADDTAQDRPDGLDLADLADEAPVETLDLADMEDTADAEDAETETIEPCTLTETCNRLDDDGDGSIDEGCPMALKFTDGSPPPDTWVDVIFTANESHDCVRLRVTPPSGAPFVVDESINGVFFGSYYKWNFQVQLVGDPGEYHFDVLEMTGCPTTCDCTLFSIMTGSLQVNGTPDDCDGSDNDGDGRIDENCVGSIRFTDLHAEPGDVIDVVVTNDTALPCIRLEERDPCTNSRDIHDSLDTGELGDPYTVWDYTLVIPGSGGDYTYLFYYQPGCTEACNCTESLVAEGEYTVCGFPDC